MSPPFVQVAWAAAASGIQFGTAVYTDADDIVEPTDVSIPADLSGKLCVVILRAGRSPVYLDTPAGWQRTMPAVTNSPVAVYWRLCDGTEGSSISIKHTSDELLTTDTACSMIAVAYPITGVATSEASYLEAEFALSATKDPPLLTPSWGSAENEWLAMYSSRYNDWSVSAYPTNYTELDFYISARSLNVKYTGLAIGRRLLTATSEDPGVFTITEGASPLTTERVMTLALRPA